MFVITHAVMAICMIGIIRMSQPPAALGMKRPTFSNLVLKIKPKRLITGPFYTKIATLLAVFIR
jgi:hypothetical protein